MTPTNGLTGPVMDNARSDRVKSVRKLASRSARNRTGTFLVEGPQAVQEAVRLHAGWSAPVPGHERGDVVREVYATRAFAGRHPDIMELIKQAGLSAREVGEEVLASMADAVTPQGIVAVCYVPSVGMGLLERGEPRLVAVLCGIQDPGNAGTMLRAADAAGADAVVLTHGSVDPLNPKAVRSAAGSTFHLPVLQGGTTREVVAQLEEAGLSVLAADGYAAMDLDELNDDAVRSGESAVLARPTAWLFGNEGQGLTEEEKGLAELRVAIPLYGQAESLNVATAATLCLYASARAQR